MIAIVRLLLGLPLMLLAYGAAYVSPPAARALRGAAHVVAGIEPRPLPCARGARHAHRWPVASVRRR